jgi:hypothetical protein
VNLLDTQIGLVEAQEGMAIIPSFGFPARRRASCRTCGATAMPLVPAGRAVWANVLKCCESLVNAIVKKIATEVPASIFFKSIRLSRICKFPRLGS